MKDEYAKKDRYDVFKAMEKAKEDAKKASSADTNKIIIWNAVFSAVTIGAVGLMYYYTNKKLNLLLESNKKSVKKK